MVVTKSPGGRIAGGKSCDEIQVNLSLYLVFRIDVRVLFDFHDVLLVTEYFWGQVKLNTFIVVAIFLNPREHVFNALPVLFCDCLRPSWMKRVAT
jgi:hypothetical protein